MSIIEAIKNGARFRHRPDGKLPEEWHVFNNGRLVVYWKDSGVTHIYTQDSISEHIELIPEEETLWVAVSKTNYGDIYQTANAFPSEKIASDIGDQYYGPGNYTIHKITRTK